MRRTYPQLLRNLKPDCDRLYSAEGAVWKEKKKYYEFPSGAKIFLVHCISERSLNDYIGGNYHFIGIDESNQFPEMWVTKLRGSLRTKNKEIKPQLFMATNPGNIGHAWHKEQFVDRCKPIPAGKVYNKEFDIVYTEYRSNKPYIDEEGNSFQYIPASVFDNPEIIHNDKKYVLKLKALPETLRRMWLEGDWNAVAGMFFENWNILHHIIDEKDFVYGKDFSKDTHELYRAYDYGLKEPFVCLFIAKDSKGRSVVFDEIIRTELVASAQAKLVNKVAKEKYGLEPSDFTDEIADPAYWTRHTEKDGEPYSYAGFYSDNGIHMTRAINDRRSGAAVVYAALENEIDGIRMLRFRSNCEETTESFPLLASEDNDAELVETHGNDHAFDAVRYYSITVTPMPGAFEIKPKRDWREEWANEETYEDGNMWGAL